jgi:16S rRNA C967 or C1407 C5-methylase (RsmB/RsmF family)/NOL1/NOP2/fmu family ribosome biogenesis protein
MLQSSKIPLPLLQSLQHTCGFDEAAFCTAHEQEPATVSFRINPFKDFGGIEFPGGTAPVPWCRCGHYLDERPSFIFDPVFHAGGYYVQEASSMFLEQALKAYIQPGIPLTVLDLCAAPGGKSTHILSLLPENSILISNEVIRTRVAPLVENITKWGVSNTAITSNDPSDFSALNGVFDIILTDAPCSGSGLIRKDPAAVKEWSEANVNLCAQRQQRILADVWPALKTGGLLIYATCAYSPQENEAVCNWLVKTYNARSVPLTIETGWGVTPVQTEENATGYRFWPHHVKGEGFFLACFIKEDDRGNANTSNGRKYRQQELCTPLSQKEKLQLPGWLHGVAGELYQQGDRIVALPEKLLHFLESDLPQMQVRLMGCTLGKMMGKEFIPDHALAMSAHAVNAPDSAGLDLENARKFLKKETFDPGFSARGWYLARYKGYSLGWFKHLGNRVNNYYPSGLRILKTLPQ